jgi:hypothetical protein
MLQGCSNKNSMALTQNRYEDQWHRVEDPDMSPCNYAHLSFNKGAKNTGWRNKCFPSLTNVDGKTGYLPVEN